MGLLSRLFGPRSRPASCVRLRKDLPMAVPEGTTEEIGAFLYGQDFTLVRAPGDPGGGGSAALTSEIDGCQVLIGWKLENLWPLAWVLGFEAEPGVEAAQLDPAVGREILVGFLGNLATSAEDLLRMARPRPAREVIRLEDLFYCAHNAVRSAQLGGSTVPPGFDPVAHGGAVHERRHALTWSLSPGVAWGDTDLST